MDRSGRPTDRLHSRAPTQDLAVASIARQLARLGPERREELEAYLRAARQRCWVCNAPDAELVRLQRRAERGWVAIGTLQLCSACLEALCTPALVRRLGIGRSAPEPPHAPVRPAGPEPQGNAATPADTDTGDQGRPLELVKGA